MRSRRLAGAALLGVWILAAPWRPMAGQQTGEPRRIVSLIPAVTEMLVAAGATSRLAGVSSFDTTVPEGVPRVGGLIDPAVERILSLRPDLVIVYESQEDLREQLARARIPTFVYVHSGLDDVTATLRAVGERAGVGAHAAAVADDIEARLQDIARRVHGRPRPATLLVFGRQPDALRGIYASGGVGFLHDMLVVAGGRNVFGDIERQSVQVNTEAILTRAPEVIVELVASDEENSSGRRRSWGALASVPAVRDGRVEILAGSEFVVPGPRIAEATLALARALHPEAFRQAVVKQPPACEIRQQGGARLQASEGHARRDVDEVAHDFSRANRRTKVRRNVDKVAHDFSRAKGTIGATDVAPPAPPGYTKSIWTARGISLAW